jgi:hypothetical protein
MRSKTKTAVLIPALSRTADFNGAYTPLEPLTEAIEIRTNLTAIARTTTGTLQVRLEASYDEGATFETVAVGALAIAAAQERFLYPFSAGLAVATATVANGAAFYELAPQTVPTATHMKHHLKPHGYRAVADMAGDTTSYDVTVTLRQVAEV